MAATPLRLTDGTDSPPLSPSSTDLVSPIARGACIIVIDGDGQNPVDDVYGCIG